MSGEIDLTKLIRDSATHICVYTSGFIKSPKPHVNSLNDKIKILDMLDGRWIDGGLTNFRVPERPDEIIPIASYNMWNNEGDLRNGRHHSKSKCHENVPSEVKSYATHIDITTGIFYDATGTYVKARGSFLDNRLARKLDRDTALWSESEISIKDLKENNYDFFNLMRKNRQGRLETRLARF
jgi:hypothetical protein